MPSLTIPFVGSIMNRNTNPLAGFADRDQYFENCYPEITRNPITGKTSVQLYKRVGVAIFRTVTGTNIPFNGGAVWAGRSAGPTVVFPMVTSGNDLTVIDGAGTLFTQAGIGLDSVYLSETLISNVANVTYIATKQSDLLRHGWFFPEGGASTEITDADFPPNQGTPLPIVGEMVHMDGFAFVLTKGGQIYNSDLNSLSAWTATAFQSAQSIPDNGVGLARYKNLIVAFGTLSIEFFQNAGTTPSPLVPIGNAVRHVGALGQSDASHKCIMSVADSVYFIGQDLESGTLGVYRLNGYTPEKISNAAIDKFLTEQMDSGTPPGIAGAFPMHGMTHVLLEVAAAGGSIRQAPCFCVQTGLWWYMKASSAIQNFVSCAGANGVAYFTTDQNDNIYATDAGTPVFADNAEAYTQTVQIGPVDHDTPDRKFVNRLRINGDTQGSTSNVGVSYSDDDGVTFSTARNIDMSAAVKELTRLGSYRNGRLYKFTHSAATANRMRSVTIDYERGTS